MSKQMIHLNRLENGGLEAFSTPQHKYIPVLPGSPIGAKKWTEYERLKMVFGFGRTFTQLYEAIGMLEKTLASDSPLADIRLECILLCNSLRKGIVDESKDRYNQAFYLCTIFINREGDDPYDWSNERAVEYIKDWEQSNVNEQDLFFFALSMTSELARVLKAERERLASQEAKLSGLGS